MTGFEPLLEFPNGSKDFVLGFEAGRLWEQLKWAVDAGECFEQSFHSANAEIVLRMCDHLHVTHRAEIIDDVWIHGYFEAGVHQQ